MASLQERVIGAMRLQPSTFEEVEHDQAATSQAAMVVAAVAVAGVIAGIRHITVLGALTAIIFQLLGWVLASFVVLLVGTKLFPGKNTEADLGQMLRTMGFAQSAGLFSVLGIIPLLGFLIQFAVSIWVLVAMVIGVRQALDYDDTLKAVIVCVVAWVIMFIMMLLATPLGIGAAGLAGMF
ncbi:MAG: hypothetical protein ABS36_07215 [Acidobacteria bacterium SCN 69-37]|nr:MAG: hypothetical protein ABS36_07215 [Acidobacteria bacterium SCN 69-37]